MKALITGATGGLGKAFAQELAANGWQLYLCGQNEKKLRALAEEMPKGTRFFQVDLSKREGCLALYEAVKEEDVDFVIHNAAIGCYGHFAEHTLAEEERLFALDAQSVLLLTKCFLNDFVARDWGWILNVSSTAGFAPGPLMSGYYAAKSYVLRLTEGIHEELRRADSHVTVSVFCPGPIETEFTRRAGGQRGLPGMDAQKAARQALRGLFQGKCVIYPGVTERLTRLAQRLLPDESLLRLNYQLQRTKGGKNSKDVKIHGKDRLR